MASRSLNRIILIGNLTRDPELKYTPAGTAVCTFGIATNRSWTTNDGQTKEDVQYHRIVAWQKLAELCGKLLNKGRKVFAEGRMTYRTFTGKDGIQRTIAEIVLDDFIVFGEGRKMTENVETGKKVETVQAEEEVSSKIEESKPETTKEELVNPDDIPF
ncbi:MAG: single-stranded DNA-binding protein [Patescibacteria group bacterium]|jgi:single-strand DNA-binding protein